MERSTWLLGLDLRVTLLQLAFLLFGIPAAIGIVGLVLLSELADLLMGRRGLTMLDLSRKEKREEHRD